MARVLEISWRIKNVNFSLSPLNIEQLIQVIDKWAATKLIVDATSLLLGSYNQKSHLIK